MIERLACSADVGIGTIRYYQQRGLLPVPSRIAVFGHYPIEVVERLRYRKRAQELSKRAQELGFSLDEISELLRLEVGTKRSHPRNCW